MPHCIIEYSEGLTQHIEPAALNKLVLEGALKSGLFEESHIKTRSMCYQHYDKGLEEGADDKEFIHVSLRILSGRTLEQRCHLSEVVLNQFDSMELPKGTITVEVIEMERKSYAKKVIRS